MRSASFLLSFVIATVSSAGLNLIQAQTADASLSRNLKMLTDTTGVTGYETAVGARIKDELGPSQAIQDAMGNVTVTFGSGAPHRLLVAPIDEPGYVVSEIEKDGYLRVQRLPQSGLPPHYNELQNAQLMAITTRDGRTLAGVTAGLSIHLQPGRAIVPDADDIDNLHVDLGASSGAEVLQAGVDLLSPIAAERHLMPIGLSQWAGTGVGDRYGAAVLLELARSLRSSHVQGSVTLAFVVQQWAGSRGLTRVLEEFQPDEMIFLGRARPLAAKGTVPTPSAEQPKLGSGVWMFGAGAGTAVGDTTLRQEMEKIEPKLHHAVAASLLARGYGTSVALPPRSLHMGVPLAWPLTAAETVDEGDLFQLESLLAKYLRLDTPKQIPRVNAAMPYAALPKRPSSEPLTEDVLKTLTTTYGVSGEEKMTREAVEQSLPAWAHAETDRSGNLVLHLGKHGGNAKPQMIFMAHVDELGFRVRAILPDGTLDLENKGGGSPAFYWGHPAIVHTAGGMRGGVVMLPEGYDTAQFHFPLDFRVAAKLYVGADSEHAVSDQGIKVGDTVTIPKHYSQLLNKRVSIRSLDDRVGCAAMVKAVWKLGPDLKKDVIFVWSTREELGLEGASEYAASANKAGKIPSTIFAIDTFVSADSPLESPRFGGAEVGKGFVIRAIDNSNIAPWKDVQRLQAIAVRHGVPVQYGVTGGGNDGSAFVRYGAIDVALGWPLRYSHSPAEVIDTRDLEGLASITTFLATEW